MSDAEKGPIETLCKEIEFRFNPILERDELLVAFVSELVSELGEMRGLQAMLASCAGSKPPSGASAEVLAKTRAMLFLPYGGEMMEKAREVHNFIDGVVSDDDYPCDHLIDMLSSCVSAIRFGLEKPCRSRHAAEAAQHVWKHVYGVQRFDRFTSNWQHDWARAQLTSAIALIAFPTQGEKG